MRAIQVEKFEGYDALKLVDVARPVATSGRVLVRVTAAGVTPLEHTIITGKLPHAAAPLIPGSEGAGIVEDSGGTSFAVGTRVAFAGTYGLLLPGSWEEAILALPEDLIAIPDEVSDVTAAAMPVAYLTSQLALMQAGFASGKSVLAPAIGGSVGNATYQLAKALGASTVISTAGSAEKAAQAKALGYDNVIDLSSESLSAGISRLTDKKGVDVVIDAIGGEIISAAIASLARGGVVITLGYSAGRSFQMNVTDLIWKAARIEGFSLFGQTLADKTSAWQTVLDLLARNRITPLIERTYPLKEAREALRHLIEDRPFGKIVLTV